MRSLLFVSGLQIGRQVKIGLGDKRRIINGGGCMEVSSRWDKVERALLAFVENNNNSVV